MSKTPHVTKEESLEYHYRGRAGKVEIVPTKPCETQRDLSLAYTPGVAYPCLEIAANPADSYQYTARGNLVAVVTNGTAVLGLGNIGPEAAKPVMEGKAVLFKKFADIDAVDLEIDTTNPDEFVRTVKLLEPSFGGINLEDIRAPECFEIEAKLRKIMKIPVFHDDQHGTAVITTAALINALEIAKKDPAKVRVVFSGAGAGALACARMCLTIGVKRENVFLVDRQGVVLRSRPILEPQRGEFAQETDKTTLALALDGADVFIGLSSKGLVSAAMLKKMNASPIIFAMANPDPEITYEEAKAARPDAILATGRSDYPNQVNNVLGFPFIFRGALDAGATEINEEMKKAASEALAALAREPVPAAVESAYGGERLQFGKDYIIPKPLDPRVLYWVAPAVAEAAFKSGVARRPLATREGYVASLKKLRGEPGAPPMKAVRPAANV